MSDAIVTATPALHKARISAVTSGKGGVAKTFVSVNPAAALAASGQRVRKRQLLAECFPGLPAAQAVAAVAAKMGRARE